MGHLDWMKKTAVVITGASSGVGSYFAKGFNQTLSKDSLLILTSRSKERLEKFRANDLKRENGPGVALMAWDLGNPDAEVYKKDLVDAAGNGKFEQAIIVHNAASMGDMTKNVADISDVAFIRKELDINLVSALSLNSVFLSVFKGAKQCVVNMTAPSATKALPSFGTVGMTKSSRQLVFSILAKECPDIKVLHFDPIAVDTDALQMIRDVSHDEGVRSMMAGFYAAGKVLKGEDVAAALIRLLEEGSFESGTIKTSLAFVQGDELGSQLAGGKK